MSMLGHSPCWDQFNAPARASSIACSKVQRALSCGEQKLQHTLREVQSTLTAHPFKNREGEFYNYVQGFSLLKLVCSW